MRPQISIIMPVANEEKTICSFLKRLDTIIQSLPYDFICHIIMDDFSTDKTKIYVNNYAKIMTWIDLQMSSGSGLAAAYITGYKVALSSGSEYIVEIDVDHPVELLNEIINNLKNYDAVFMSRFMESNNYKAAFHRKCISRFSTIVFNYWLNLNLSDATSGFHAFRREIIKKIDFNKFMSRGHDFQSELKYLVCLNTFSIIETPFKYINSKSSFNYKQLLTAAKTLYRMRKTHGKL